MQKFYKIEISYLDEGFMILRAEDETKALEYAHEFAKLNEMKITTVDKISEITQEEADHYLPPETAPANVTLN